MSAEMVIYVGDLERMRSFYEQCFQLTTADSGPGYHGLASDSWLVTLVQSSEAVPAATPPPRRAATPIKPTFEVISIEVLRPIVASLGGLVGAVASEWEFRNATRCDCVDPEGNVIALARPNLGVTLKTC